MSILEEHATTWKIMSQHADHHSNFREHAVAWLIMPQHEEHVAVQESYAPACHALIEEIERSMLRHVHLIPQHKEWGTLAKFCGHATTWLTMMQYDGLDFSYIFGK